MTKREDIDLLTKRVAELEAQIARLSGAAFGVGGRRFDITLNTVYRAEADGHVSVTFVGGFTGRVQILAGRTDPPTEPVCFPGDEYVSGLIRRGEYWMVATVPPGRKPAFRGIFTPLY